MNEAEITINGVVLDKVQSAAVRRALTAFLMMLGDKKFAEALGVRAISDQATVGGVLNLINM
jgi:hypothetical protein